MPAAGAEAPVHEFIHSIHVMAALVCEQYNEPEKALSCISAIREVEPTRGGDPKAHSKVTIGFIEGRILARRGDLSASYTAFTTALKLGEKLEVWLLVALGLRDLKLFVLDQTGHAEHGSRLLGALLRRLKAPSEALTRVLDGLDATALRQMPAPESAYEVHNPIRADQ